MLLVNMFAGPGTGKSTTAAHLFALLKHRGHNVELVTEYAKELCWENSPLIKDQLHILAEMNRRFSRLVGQVDIAVTDCPVLLGLVYGEQRKLEWFREAVWGVYDQYVNFDVFLQRVKPYQTAGRYQDEVEARKVDHTIHHLQPTWDIELPADELAALNLLPLVEQAANLGAC